MRTLAALLVVTLFALPALALAGEDDALLKQAEKDARAWLIITDAGKYEKGWTEASTLFQGAVTKAEWVKKARGVRAPLGEKRSRERVSATHALELPGAPDGEYVVFQFESRFEKKKSATETVTVMKDGERGFRVAGYVIK